jgi:large subunit ribosomal protein L23
VSSLDRSYQVLRKPHVTEKSSDDMAMRNTYHFRVPVDANKVEIRQAIERIFEVKVLSVNTLRNRPKSRRRGWIAGQTPSWKKAMVKLADGQSIDII